MERGFAALTSGDRERHFEDEPIGISLQTVFDVEFAGAHWSQIRRYNLFVDRIGVLAARYAPRSLAEAPPPGRAPSPPGNVAIERRWSAAASVFF